MLDPLEFLEQLGALFKHLLKLGRTELRQPKEAIDGISNGLNRSAPNTQGGEAKQRAEALEVPAFVTTGARLVGFSMLTPRVKAAPGNSQFARSLQPQTTYACGLGAVR